MPKTTPSSALVALSGAERLPTVTLAKLQATAIEQMAHISRAERETPLRAALLGIQLHQIKAGMPGEFSHWIATKLAAGSHWTPATAKKNASFYMRLGLVVVEELRATKPELLALPDSSATQLDQFEGQARHFMQRLGDFIGDRSLNELLADLGIKDGAALGGARAKGAGKKAAPLDAEQLYLFARDEIGGALQHVESVLLTTNHLQQLAGHTEEVRGVIASLRALADKVEKAAGPLLKKQAG